MKSSFDKLKKFAFNKTDVAKDRRDFNRPSKLDELALASEEMQDMRNCYDSLLSAAAATANSAYEFSESLREMGACLHDKADLCKDNESKKALAMLGEIQFELQKLVDIYRSHIFLTITNPSESLLNQLQTVQEMKQQCDEKRTIYEHMIAQQHGKGRSKSGKGEGFSSQQLKQAHTEYEEEATLCVFRLKSLKQGQTRCLLTQATRHHTAQFNFFRKGLDSLKAVDPHLKLITEKHHIDYQLSELDDNDDGEDVGGNVYVSNDNGELGFDYRPQKLGTEAMATSRNSMELDQEEELITRQSTIETTEFRLDKAHGDSQMLDSEPRTNNYSHSAPIIAEKKLDPAERIRRMRHSHTLKLRTYVLPTPDNAKTSTSTRTSSVPRVRPNSLSDQNIWHSSPIETKMNNRDSKESIPRPPPLADGLPSRQSDAIGSSDYKKIKRQAFSGPISSNPHSMKPGLSASGPLSASEHPLLASDPISQPLLPRPSSPKASYRSPTSVSPPKLSELHELPRPPGTISSKSVASLGPSGSTIPSTSMNKEFTVKNKTTFAASNTASPLPIPPVTISRSLSIASSQNRAKTVSNAKNAESSLIEKDITSPPLTPISLANANAV